MFKQFFKKASALVLALCVLALAVPMSSAVFADGFTPQNVLLTDVKSITPVIMNISTGAVQEHNQFNGGGAVATLNDGDTTNVVDVYGANDWGNYSGVLIELNDSAYCGSVSIFSGYEELPDTYKVFASNALDTLYSNVSLLSDGVVCKGTEQSLSINRTVKYIALFLTQYTYNGRIAEVQVWSADSAGVEEFTPENLMISGVASFTPVIKSISTGAVQEHNQFNGGGAVATLNDGNTSNNIDVYGANDWDNYSGVQIELSEAAYCASVSIFSGFADYPDTYDVYASDSLETLYAHPSLVASGVVCKGAEQSLAINRTVKYLAIFLTDYTYNGRIAEVQLWSGKDAGGAQETMENLLINHATAQCILFDKTNGTVTFNDKFNQNGALATATDGDIAIHTDVWGWDGNTGVGVQYTLDSLYLADTIDVYSGFEAYPDAYRVYASDDLSTLYNEESQLCANLECKGYIEFKTDKPVKYVAFIFDSDGGRVKEYEVFGVAKALPTFDSENVLTGAAVKSVAQYIDDGHVGEEAVINETQLAAFTDGDTATHIDLSGTLDWDPARRAGAEYSLSEAAYIGEIKLYASIGESFPETYRVYASDSLETLYTADNMLVSGASTTGNVISVVANKQVQYIAFFCESYEGNPRFKEIEAYTACAHAQTEVKNAVEPTCTEPGNTGDVYCLVCSKKVASGEEVPAKGHTSSDWIVDVEATAEAAGHQHKVCTVCGITLEEEDIPQLSTHTPGDINSDGKVNNKDLTRLFQYLSDWDVEVNEAALDVNGDGKINNKDLTRLFQYLSDWDVVIY